MTAPAGGRPTQSGHADADGFDGQDTALASRPAGAGGVHARAAAWPEDLPWLALVHAPLLVTTPDGLMVRAATDAAVRLLGRNPAGLSLRDLLGAFAEDQLKPLLAGAGPAGELALQCVTPRGVVTFGFRAEALPVAGGAAGGTVLTLSDYGASAPAEGRAVDWAHTLEEVVDGLPVGVRIYDEAFNQLFANRLSDDLLGYDTGGTVPHHDDWWAHGIPDPGERRAVLAEWRDKVAAARATPDRYSSMEHEVTCRDGLRRIMQFRFRFIGDTYTVVFWDVTKRRRLEEEMRRLAGTDDLTGLVNRRGFSERARAALEAGGDGAAPVSLLMLDVDHFKKINDIYGHSAGDRVLKEIARRCRRLLRPEDVLARLGGEEFAVLLPGASLDAAHDVARALLAAIGEAPMELGALSLTVQASIGGVARTAGATLEDLLERADRALYAAKASGRNRVMLASGPF